MSINLKQLSKILKLSPTTVSRALAGYDDVSERTRQRVQKAAELHGYQPNPVARRLQKGRTEAIGIVLPPGTNYFSGTFFTELLGGISEHLSQSEHDLVIAIAPDMESEFQALRRMVEGKRVDGVFLVQSRIHDARIQYLHEKQFPFVVYGRTETPEPYAYIDMNGTRIFQEACEYLYDLGHRRIAFINGPEELFFPRCCKMGYLQGLEKLGIPFDPKLLRHWHGTTAENGGYRHTLDLMRLPDPPTALLCFTEASQGVLRGLGDLGLQGGRDVSVIGYDDLEVARYSSPPLTTMSPPVRQVGQRLVEVLFALIQGAEPHHFQEIWEPAFVFRKSTGPGPWSSQARSPATFGAETLARTGT